MSSTNVNNVIYTNPSDGLSYTNKDFNSIYNEELDLVKSLSPRWDPTISNESDPGVVLLKENAIIADKENYNIDKNVLEVFPMSVSQQGNARQLYDSLGYGMHWYQAASTTIQCKYIGDIDIASQSNLGNPLTIPMFTMVCNDSGEYVFTTTQNLLIGERNKTVSVSALQGVVNDFEINGVTKITLNFLDSNYRLYFPDVMVAENGIFIASTGDSVNWDDWKCVQNLESYEPGNSVYTFGVLPNSNTCYIQFPQDISDLIGDGLQIKYLITSGEAGNVPVGTVEKFYEDISYTHDGTEDIITDDLVVSNATTAFNGQDPESLTDAYRNYKKTVGTFNTLVTCRDYENAIYNLRDSYGTPYASNAVVADRTNDINDTWHLMISENPDHEARRLARSAANPSSDMNAFALRLYILGGRSTENTKSGYAQSFGVNGRYPVIESLIEEYKSIQHDYEDTTTGNPFIIKNYYNLDGSLITYSKVTAQEAKNIEENVNTAIYKNLNARQLDFGSPLGYDALIDIIKNADPRIKSVLLSEPSYNASIMKGDGSETAWNPSANHGSSNFETITIAKLIANGNTQLYNFDDRFTYLFNQTINSITENISYLDTEVIIPVSNGAVTNYSVRENESVILTHPSLIQKTVYSQNIKYEVSGSDVIEANKFVYVPGDKLTLTYKVDGKSVTTPITGIIYTDKEGGLTGSGWLSSSESISTYEINQTTLYAQDADKCYWVMNNPENILFHNGESEIILGQNEIFVYTDKDMNGLTILGQGTKLAREGSTDEVSAPKVEIANDITASQLESIDWITLNSKGISELTITEMTQVVLGEGCTVSCTVASNISNNPQGATNPSAEDENGDDIELDNVDGLSDGSTSCGWQIYSRLNINSTSLNPQKLIDNQLVSIYDKEESIASPSTTLNSEWTLKPSISFVAEETTYSVNFLSNGNTYSEITIGSNNLKYGNDIVYGSSGWGNNNFRLIKILDGTDANLVSWLVSNSTSSGIIITNSIINFNTDITLPGGPRVELFAVNTDGEKEYPISCVAYTQAALQKGEWDGNYIKLTETDIPDVAAPVPLEETITFASGMINVDSTTNQNHTIVKIYVSGSDSISESNYITVTGGDGTLTIDAPGTYFVTPAITSTAMSITAAKNGSPKFTLLISPVNITGRVGDSSVTYYNSDIIPQGITSDTDTDITTYIGYIKTLINSKSVGPSLAGYNPLTFDYTYRASQDTAHYIQNPLSSDAFWDVSHPLNRFTIAQLRSNNIKVISSSKI